MKGIVATEFLVLSYLLSGVVYGASAGISPGPLLMLVIRETLTVDRRAGISVALAPLITDIPVVVLSLVLLSKLSGVTIVPGIVSFAGAAFLIYLGIETIIAAPERLEIDPSRRRSFGKALITNLLSPNPYMFWLLIGAPTTLRAAESHPLYGVVFVGGFYLLLVGVKITVAILTGKSKQVLSSGVYRLIMRVLGAALLLFAGLLIRDGIRYLG